MCRDCTTTLGILPPHVYINDEVNFAHVTLKAHVSDDITVRVVDGSKVIFFANTVRPKSDTM